MIHISVNSGKNIDDLYHFTKTFESFIAICDSLVINPGSTTEAGPRHTKSDFISFTRDKNMILHNGNRYVAGFILNGDLLTDQNNTEPISYIGYNLNNNTNAIRLRTITSYDDGTYTMYIQPFGSLNISKKVYTVLANILDSLPESTKQDKHMEISTGKRRVNGHMIVQKYHIKSPNGVSINVKHYPELAEIIREITVNERVNENEERIWNRDINIKRALKGVYIRKDQLQANMDWVRIGLDDLVQNGFKLKPADNEIGYEDSPAFRILII